MKRQCRRCGLVKQHRARGLCANCYKIVREAGELENYPLVRPYKVFKCSSCGVEGNAKSGASGLCKKCYYLVKKKEPPTDSLAEGICMRCDEHCKIQARGLCLPCYDFVRSKGILDDYGLLEGRSVWETELYLYLEGLWKRMAWQLEKNDL